MFYMLSKIIQIFNKPMWKDKFNNLELHFKNNYAYSSDYIYVSVFLINNIFWKFSFATKLLNFTK